MARDRIEQFDGLRAFAFLAVFARHMLHVRFAQMGVDLFFVLSGFLITRNLIALRSQTTGSAFRVFFYRRVLRIIPPYYLALTVMLLVGFLPLHESPWYFGFVSNIRDSIYPVVGGPPVTMWSIAVEEQFYLLWPIVILLLPRRALIPVLIGTIVAAPLVRMWFSPGNSDAVYRLMISRMDLLAMGALVAVVDLRAPTWFREHRTRFVLLGINMVAVFAVLTIAMPATFAQDRPLYDVLGYSLAAVVFTCLLVVVRVTDTGPLYRLLCTPVLRYVGQISYMAYLVHVVAIELVLRMSLPAPVRIVLALAMTLAFASASWFLVEQPLQRLRGKVQLTPREPPELVAAP